jgi:hypothetical protein
MRSKTSKRKTVGGHDPTVCLREKEKHFFYIYYMRRKRKKLCTHEYVSFFDLFNQHRFNSIPGPPPCAAKHLPLEVLWNNSEFGKCCVFSCPRLRFSRVGLRLCGEARGLGNSKIVPTKNRIPTVYFLIRKSAAGSFADEEEREEGRRRIAAWQSSGAIARRRPSSSRCVPGASIPFGPPRAFVHVLVVPPLAADIG